MSLERTLHQRGNLLDAHIVFELLTYIVLANPLSYDLIWFQDIAKKVYWAEKGLFALNLPVFGAVLRRSRGWSGVSDLYLFDNADKITTICGTKTTR